MVSWFKQKKSVILDKEKIEELLTRGVERHYPSEDFLRQRLFSGDRLKLYLGIDPTGPTLHLGHAIPLRKLKQFQDLGHEIILLIGDFTARIGDPDKKEVRKQLTRKEVLENAKLYKEQASLFVSFKGKNAAKLMFNNSWHSKLNFSDVLDLASKITVQQMLERDMFRKRIQAEKPIYIHEFMYPLIQGYDAVAMNVDGEVGGNDQTFNMLVGRTLLKELKGKEKFVLPMKLLVDTTGSKMGKTTGNMLSFLDSPEEKFGKIMAWTDEMILIGFELCTDIDLSKIKNRLDGGENPRDIKMELAYEIVKTYHSDIVAKGARDAFVKTFQKGNTPNEIKSVKAGIGEKLYEVFIREEIVNSKIEFRRLIEAGAITNKTDNEKITEMDAPARPSVYKIGKHRFFEIKAM